MSEPVSALMAASVVNHMAKTQMKKSTATTQNPTTPFQANGPSLKNGMSMPTIRPIAQ